MLFSGAVTVGFFIIASPALSFICQPPNPQRGNWQDTASVGAKGVGLFIKKKLRFAKVFGLSIGVSLSPDTF